MRLTGNSDEGRAAAYGLPVECCSTIERWLRAPVRMPNGDMVARERGNPAKGQSSKSLAGRSLSSLCRFDCWMQREHPDVPFERYADDAICHCQREAQALELRQALEQRFADCKLQLHPQKTKVVYCKDANRPGKYPERSFDFLGYTFRPREAIGRHRKRFVEASFRRSAVRPPKGCGSRCEGGECICAVILPVGGDRQMGSSHPCQSGCDTMDDFTTSKLRTELHTIDAFIVRWVSRKYKRFRGHTLAAHWEWLRSLRRAQSDPVRPLDPGASGRMMGAG